MRRNHLVHNMYIDKSYYAFYFNKNSDFKKNNFLQNPKKLSETKKKQSKTTHGSMSI